MSLDGKTLEGVSDFDYLRVSTKRACINFLTAERPERPRAPARKPSAASQNATPLGTGPGPRPGASLAGGAFRGRRGARERGPGAGSSGQEDPTLLHGRDRGAEGGRARLPGSSPSGSSMAEKKALPETEPKPTRHDPGRENQIEVPPRAGTTPERPAVLGRQGGLDEEEQGPRGNRGSPDQGRGWASPSRLAWLGSARLEPGYSRPAGVETPAADGRRAGGARPPLVARYPGPSPVRAEGFEDSRSFSRSSGRDRRRRGCPDPSRSGNTPRPRGLLGRAPGNVLGIVESDSQEGKPDVVPGRHATRSVDGRRRLPSASPAPAGGRTLRKVACDYWRWITWLTRR
ncbi:hypothetical protein NDU88_006655 [Pleurodeles waltl]|uniref:Uncharacterized protein n=1 Tax=Pleurodeles waltl TaxID=8319 RepID=A0AAV7QP69_PLEWA|nr:hypothetical protein NDU88_006655 [Pleurodeles waltl]